MKRIGCLGLSDPCKKETVEKTVQFLQSLDADVLVSDRICEPVSGKKKAEVFNAFMKEDLDMVFDLSGGDSAHTTLPYIDFQGYKESKTIVHGYSDLTCVLNPLAMYRDCVLFQIAGNTNTDAIASYIQEGNESLIIDTAMGGNVRCFLKLAGTQWFPDLKGQSLFLESRSGDLGRVRSYFSQLEQLGVFEQISRLIIGQFTEVDQSGQREALLEMIHSYKKEFSCLESVGHSHDSFAIRIQRK